MMGMVKKGRVQEWCQEQGAKLANNAARMGVNRLAILKHIYVKAYMILNPYPGKGPSQLRANLGHSTLHPSNSSV